MKPIMTDLNETYGRHKNLYPPRYWLLILLALLVAACAPTPEPTPEPTKTPTPFPQRSSFNDNVQAMNAAQAALNQMEFGFAPLLLEDETRITIETDSKQPLARLAYSPQPAEATDWPTGDSFILSLATRSILLDLPQVERVALGSFDLAAPVANLEDTIPHVAVWVTFADHTQAVIDLSPLSTDFAAQHKAQTFISDATDLQEQFDVWREGVFLDELQPMAVIEEAGQSYYLLSQVTIYPEQYEFTLRAHIAQVADPMQPLRLVQGTLTTVRLDRLDFGETQADIAAAGPEAFAQNTELFNRQGNDSEPLNAVLDDNLHLLWHLITKLEHDPLDPEEVTPATVTPTRTPSPTPTPTPTATPKRAQPLITS